MKPRYLFLFLIAVVVGESAFAVDPGVPARHLAAANRAKASFDGGDYREAERIYETILHEVPDNLYVLSNLGVVRFRAGKLESSEVTFRRAIAVNPTDDFSHCTLGIVYYSQARYEEAVKELTKALTLNPGNVTAQNYLQAVTAQEKLEESKAREPSPKIRPSLGDFLTPLEKSRLQPPSARP